MKEYIENNVKLEYNVLDLSCGTGLYLEKQIQYFDEVNINWHGLDLSDQMLKKANEKVKNVKLTAANVEDMPYYSEAFDYICNNYAFHHYTHK